MALELVTKLPWNYIIAHAVPMLGLMYIYLTGKTHIVYQFTFKLLGELGIVVLVALSIVITLTVWINRWVESKTKFECSTGLYRVGRDGRRMCGSCRSPVRTEPDGTGWKWLKVDCGKFFDDPDKYEERRLISL